MILKSKVLFWLLAPFLGFFISFLFSSFSERSEDPSLNKLTASAIRPVEAVAALGQLSPLGDGGLLRWPSIFTLSSVYKYD